jgi:Na+/H+-dicarboxylate symporter
MRNLNVWWLVLGMVLGIAGGILFPSSMLKITWIGQTFINMLKLICLPLIFSALVSAIVSMGDFKTLGKIGSYTAVYLLISVSVAVLIGLIMVNIFHPGIGLDPRLINQNQHPISTVGSFTFVTFIQNLFPDNLILAASKFQVIPIVIFAIIFSIACVVTENNTNSIKDFFTALRHVFITMIGWVMYLAPIGLFSLLGTAVAHSINDHLILNSLKGLGLFIIMFLGGLILQILWQGLAVLFIIRKHVKKIGSATAPTLMTAFATSSSMATLPVALESAQKLGIPTEISRFVLPLASTINLSGTAMYEAVAAIFFSQILGIDLTIWNQITIFFIAIIAGIGATGIPEGGLITMVSVLHAVNIPTTAIGLLLPFDRILDRCRTMTNVWGDLMCTMIVNYFMNTQKEVLHPTQWQVPRTIQPQVSSEQ